MKIKQKFITGYLTLLAILLVAHETLPESWEKYYLTGFFAVGFGVYVILIDKLSQRIIANATALVAIGKGDYSAKLNTSVKDEVGEVARGIKTMIQEMETRDKERHNREIKLENLRRELQDQQLALINVLEDVTDEKELEQSRNESLLETVGEGIVVTDGDGLMSYVNPAMETMLGYDDKELIGQDFATFFTAYDLQNKLLKPLDISSNAAVTAKGGESKVQVLAKNGKKKAVLITATPINVKGEFRGIMRVIHDFSEDLALQQQKDDFFSIASHELRTPLTVISGNLDMMMSGMSDSRLGPQDKDMLQDSLSAADRLTRMVTDFLNVSRIDQGRIKVDLKKLDVSEIAASAVKDIANMADERNLKLIERYPKKKLKVTVDEDKLKEIFINLLGNSLKFTQKGQIVIEIKKKANNVEVRISDTGMGISLDKQVLLFGRFQQAMDRTLAREAGGTGLGLYISREFARLMGGELRLEKSELKKGSTFLLTLPIAK